MVTDDSDTGVTIGTGWTAATVTTLGMPVGTGYDWRDAGTGSSTISAPLNVSAAGEYRVYARWAATSNRATNAPFTVHHDGGTTLTTVNQKINGGIWMLLGTYDLTPASSPKVVLTAS